MNNTIIDKIYIDFKELLKYLEDNQQVSLKSDADNNFKKILLLSAASYFEHEITKILIDYIKIKSNNNDELYSFLKKKGIDRQYYTYFDWERKKANTFFSLFGEDFKKKMITKVESDSKLEDSIESFLELGNLRNKLVHQNFAAFSLDKTTEEIYELYKKSLIFVIFLSTIFK